MWLDRTVTGGELWYNISAAAGAAMTVVERVLGADIATRFNSDWFSLGKGAIHTYKDKLLIIYRVIQK